jgi:DNA-binding MarR family transcriptional regulator
MDDELIDLLRMVSSGFRARMQARIAASGMGLTTFQARLVNLVGRHEGVSQLALGSFMDRNKAQIARAVKELEVRGLVARRAHSADWRAKSVVLTAEGKRMHAHLGGVRKQLAVDVLGSLSDKEKQALRSGLEKMSGVLREQDS